MYKHLKKKSKIKKNWKLAKRSYMHCDPYDQIQKSSDQLHTYGSNKIMIIKYERLEKGGIKKSKKRKDKEIQTFNDNHYNAIR